MPMYEYRCPSCGREFEEIARQDERVPCPACAAPSEPLISACHCQCSAATGSYTPASTGGGKCGGCSGGNCAGCH